MNNEDKMKKYALIQSYIRELEDEAGLLKEDILRVVMENNQPIKLDMGTFSRTTRKTYEFSETLKVKEASIKNELKELQAKEVEDGTAIVTETVSLMYRPASQDKVNEKKILDFILSRK